jgi:DNA topoisomerase VI subunit B
MEEKDIKNIVDSVKAEVDKKGFMNSEGVEKLITEAVEAIKAEMPKDLEAAVKEQGVRIQELLESKKKAEEPKSRNEIIEKNFDQILKDLKTNKSASLFIPSQKTLLQRSAAGSSSREEDIATSKNPGKIFLIFYFC